MASNAENVSIWWRHHAVILHYVCRHWCRTWVSLLRWYRFPYYYTKLKEGNMVFTFPCRTRNPTSSTRASYLNVIFSIGNLIVILPYSIKFTTRLTPKVAVFIKTPYRYIHLSPYHDYTYFIQYYRYQPTNGAYWGMFHPNLWFVLVYGVFSLPPDAVTLVHRHAYKRCRAISSLVDVRPQSII